jgi:hypothetical protein
MVQTTLAEPGGKSWLKHISIAPQKRQMIANHHSAVRRVRPARLIIQAETVLEWHRLGYLRSPRWFSWAWTRDGFEHVLGLLASTSSTEHRDAMAGQG